MEAWREMQKGLKKHAGWMVEVDWLIEGETDAKGECDNSNLNASSVDQSSEALYEAKFLRGEILPILVNVWHFAETFPCCYFALYGECVSFSAVVASLFTYQLVQKGNFANNFQ